jgi:hypothetical protein
MKKDASRIAIALRDQLKSLVTSFGCHKKVKKVH